MNRWSARLLVGLVLLALVAFPAGAQGVKNAGPRYGAHTGYIFEEIWLAGAQLFWPISSIVDLYPSFDYFFESSGSAWALNADLKAVSPSREVSWYLGTGLGFYQSSGGGSTSSSSATLWNLFTGLEGRNGRLLPYIEVRLSLGEGGGAFRIAGGLNWR